MNNSHRLIMHGGELRVFQAQANRLIGKMILRLFRGIGAFGGLLALCGWSGMSAAAVIWDYSPSAIGGTGRSDEVAYSNETRFQNFVERFQFDRPAMLTGMDIYSGGPPVFASCGVFPSCGVVGDLVTVRIFRDVAGQPGALLTSFWESISAIDSVGAAPGNFVSFRKHADFTLPVPLLGDTQYWIGLSGSPTNVLLMGLLTNPPDDGHMWSLYDDTPRFNVAIGDMAFRLEGSFPTPVPGAFSLLAIGLTGLGLVRRVLTR